MVLDPITNPFSPIQQSQGHGLIWNLSPLIDCPQLCGVNALKLLGLMELGVPQSGTESNRLGTSPTWCCAPSQLTAIAANTTQSNMNHKKRTSLQNCGKNRTKKPKHNNTATFVFFLEWIMRFREILLYWGLIIWPFWNRVTSFPWPLDVIMITVGMRSSSMDQLRSKDINLWSERMTSILFLIICSVKSKWYLLF